MSASERESPLSAGAGAVPNAEDASLGDVRGGAPARIEQELNGLCLELKGSVWAQPLSDAKAALAGRDYENAAAFVGSTWESYRQRRWQVLRHQPDNPGALSAEDRFLATAKLKAEGILRRLEAVLEGLRKLAAAGTAGSKPDAGHEDSKVAMVDMGSFSQLLTAAQRTVFEVNTDAILSARDRDFRNGKYRKAFGVIEGLSKRFDASADGRRQTLAQEDVAYRSGTLKMSPKEWQAKQRQDRVNTMNIERTQRYFRRLLSALSVMAAQAEAQSPPPGEER